MALALVMLAFGLFACNDSENIVDDGRDLVTDATTAVVQKNLPFEVTDDVTDYVMIDVEGYGKIVVELYPETAPITVANFKGLVSEGFYDGLIFHRVIKGFMIQGGGFTAGLTEKGASPIVGEFLSNGISNTLMHTRGVISMARTPDPNSATSQFFIMHGDAPHLDGDYAAFGMTVYGIEVVDAIATVATNYNDMPTNDIMINTARFVTPKNDFAPTHTTSALTTAAPPTSAVQDDIPFEVVDDVTNYVIIDVINYGKIVVELKPNTAPITVDNFKKLVSEKFYDGLIFHRVIKNFVIQGGGFTASKEEKQAATIKGEFSSNGIENDLKHTRGVISMARATDPNSASSQFFIMHEDAPHLDGDYAAFGETVYGIEVVDAIATTSTMGNDMPTSNIIISSIRFAKHKN